MIIPNQKNLKVHFAGAENVHHVISGHTANVQYFLLTIFPLICQHFDMNAVRFFGNRTPEEVAVLATSVARHVIMDSGLFSLMFGSYKISPDLKYLERWMHEYTDFVIRSGFAGTCVEIDCQKILNPQTAWKLRKKFRDMIPNRVINVFHFEDGQKGLDRLIEFSDYIALSIPELRILRKKDYAIRLAHYIKEKKPDIDIHLLGCTDLKLLRLLNFCSTSDSTSWYSSMKYGQLKTTAGIFHIDSVKDDKLAEWVAKIKATEKKLDLKVKINYEYVAKESLSAEQAKRRYSLHAGSQA